MSRRSKISRTPANREKPHHRGVLFIEGVPESTKVDFKAACAKKQITMRDCIIGLMREFINEVDSR